MAAKREARTSRKESRAGKAPPPPCQEADLRLRIRELQARVDELRAENAQLRERKSRTRILASARQLQATLDAIRDGICLIDWQGRILRYNRAFQTFLGRATEEIAGRFYSEVVRLVPAMVEAVPIEKAWQLRARVGLDVAVGDRWFHVSVDPLLDEMGESGGAVCMIRDITVRKDAELALRERERRLRLAASQAPAILWTTDSQLRFTSSNGAGLAALGLRPDELVGMDLFEYFQTSDRDFPAIAAHRRALAGESVGFDLNLGGRVFQSRVEPLRDDEGTIIGTSGVAQDVTECVRMEEALRDSELRLQATIERLPVILWTTDADLRITSSVGRGLERLGLSANQLVGRTIQECVGNPDRDYLPTRMHLRALAGESVNYEMEFGGRHWSTHIEPLRDAVGRVQGVIGLSLDITEQRKVELALGETEERLRRVFESAPIGIALVSEDRRFLAMNPALCRLLGYTEKELLGKTFLEVTHPDDLKPSLELERAGRARAGDSLTLEKRYLRKTGETIWVRLTVRAIQDTDGRFLHWLTMVQDITEQKLLEEQLRQSQKLEAVGRLAGLVAHDFNNMLAAIKGYTDIVTRGRESDERLVSNMAEVRQVLHKAAELTRQLLAIGRPQPLAPRVVDLGRVVEEMSGMTRRLMGERIRLDVRSEPGLHPVMADPGLIEQVVMNLALNARDAMPEGGDLTIEARNVELDETYVARHLGVRPGAHVLLSVSDTGTGMDEEVQAHLFEPFFTTKKNGTGLGLSAVYGAIRQMSGHVYVESAPGKGTTIRIYIPAAPRRS